jgi:hypothetical protein
MRCFRSGLDALDVLRNGGEHRHGGFAASLGQHPPACRRDESRKGLGFFWMVAKAIHGGRLVECGSEKQPQLLSVFGCVTHHRVPL